MGATVGATATGEQPVPTLTDVAAHHEQQSVPKASSDAPGVYGVLYRLPPDDEEELDICEGVPTAYEKAMLNVELVKRSATWGSSAVNEYTQFRQKQLPTLVYVDYHRVEAARPKDEYVGRMNNGIDEARRDWGSPEWYVDQVMRPFIKSETS